VNVLKALGGVLIGVVALYVLLSLVGAVFIGSLKDRARRNHERRHGADNNWPRFGF